MYAQIFWHIMAKPGYKHKFVHSKNLPILSCIFLPLIELIGNSHQKIPDKITAVLSLQSIPVRKNHLGGKQML